MWKSYKPIYYVRIFVQAQPKFQLSQGSKISRRHMSKKNGGTGKPGQCWKSKIDYFFHLSKIKWTLFNTSPTGEVFYLWWVTLSVYLCIYLSDSHALRISDSDPSKSEFWNILEHCTETVWKFLLRLQRFGWQISFECSGMIQNTV